MPGKNKAELIHNGDTIFKNLKFIRTDYRIEKLSKVFKHKNLDKILFKKFKKKSFMVIYTHEYELKKKLNINCLNDSIKVLSKNLKLQNLKP